MWSKLINPAQIQKFSKGRGLLDNFCLQRGSQALFSLIYYVNLLIWNLFWCFQADFGSKSATANIFNNTKNKNMQGMDQVYKIPVKHVWKKDTNRVGTPGCRSMTLLWGGSDRHRPCTAAGYSQTNCSCQ